MTAKTFSSDIPAIEVDPYSLDTLRNPYPFHERLRELGPVVYLEKYGTFALGRFDEVRAMLKDWPSFTSTGGAGLSDIRKSDNWRQPGPVVESDPPQHTAVRSVLTKIISPAVIRGWQEAFDREAISLAERVCDNPHVDGAVNIAEAFVTTVFPASLGLKPHRKNMVTVGNFNFNALGPKNALYEHSVAEMAKITDWYETAQRREGVEPGSFAEMIFLAEDSGELGPGLAQGVVRTFLRGGMDTTISGISAALMILSRERDVWKMLRADRSRLKFVFDEAIRLESPIQSYFRTTTKNVELGGVMLEPDVKVQVYIGSANRDPRKWTRPDVFDINRSAIPHLAFGHGIHVCIGQLIARMEAESVLNALLDRIVSIEPAGEPVYRPLNTLRTLGALPLKLTLQ
jgi:4-methoxybenzoate monooxygenase (O-demethylating)